MLEIFIKHFYKMEVKAKETVYTVVWFAVKTLLNDFKAIFNWGIFDEMPKITFRTH
jgi:hypothetical protein